MVLIRLMSAGVGKDHDAMDLCFYVVVVLFWGGVKFCTIDVFCG